ncbi:MAG: insulinase family protein [Nibricoccus sp.]
MKRLLILFVLALVPVVSAETSPLVPLDPAVQTGKLPNGLTYYIRKNVKPEKRAELRLAVKTGSVQEDDDQLGMAHFVEHMCFNGTEHFPKNELTHYLESLGVRFGPDLNAYTSFDETVYMLTIPTDKPDILVKGIQIMSDWAHEVTFDSTEVEKERGVVVEEWRLGRGANQRMRDKYVPVLFKDSKYATRLPIGNKDAIEKNSHDAITRFYRDWYTPENMALVVVGDIDPAEILNLITKEFDHTPASKNARPVVKYPVPDNEKPLYAIVSDKEATHNVVQLCFKTPPPSYQTVGEYRRHFVENLFTHMLNQRFFEIVQQPNPPFIQAGGSFGELWTRAKSAFQVYAVVDNNGFQRALAATLTEVERVQRHGFTDSELARAKQTLLKGLEQAYNERTATPSSQFASRYVQVFLDGNPAGGIEYDYTYAKENMAGITVDEVNRLAAEWITPRNRVAIVQCVEKEGLSAPTVAELEAIGQQVAASKIEPYQEKKIASSLMEKVPAPAKIIEEKQIAEVGVTELKFANGVRVILKPTTFQKDEILFRAFRAGGQSLFPEDYNLSAQLAAPYRGVAGMGNFSTVELRKILAGKRASVSLQLELYYEKVSGSCAVADRETMLQLTHLLFTQPRRDEGAYASLITRVQASLKNQLSNPMVAFRNEVEKARYNNHPRNPDVLPTDADWATVNLDKVLTVSKTRLENAAGFTFVFVGSFTVEEIKPLLATYIGSLPGKAGAEPAWRDLNLRSVIGPVDQAIYHGSDPKSFALISLDGAAQFSRDESHKLWSLGSILQRAYIDKLREELSGVYGFSVSASLSRVPYQHFNFDLALPCAPENVQKLTDAAYAEIKRIQENGPNPEELQKEIETQRRATEKDAKENSGWLWKLEKIYTNNEPFTRLSNPEELISLVTKEEMQRVAKQYLKTENCLRYTLYPEKKN